LHANLLEKKENEKIVCWLRQLNPSESRKMAHMALDINIKNIAREAGDTRPFQRSIWKGEVLEGH